MSTTAILKQQLSKTTVNSMAEVLSITYIRNTIKGTEIQEGGVPFVLVAMESFMKK